MHVFNKSLIAIATTAILMSACSKEEATTPAPETEAPAAAAPAAPADSAAAPAAAPAAPAAESSGPGGYVPTPEERYVPEGGSAAGAEATPPATDPARANEEKAKTE